jgi:lipopolysaccharide transport system permease protein
VRVERSVREQRSLGRAIWQRWTFLLVCALLGLLFAGLILLARPALYEVEVRVRYDPQRYPFAVQDAALSDALDLEARDLLALHHPADLNTASPVEQPVEFRVADEPNTLLAVGRATTAGRAGEIAAHGGLALSEAFSTLHGMDLLQILLRRAIALQGEGRPEPATPLTPYLFVLLDVGLVPYDPAIPVAAEAPALTAADVADMTLALQRLEERQTARINALFEQENHTGDKERLQAISDELAALTWRREHVRRTLLILYREQDVLVTGADSTTPTTVELTIDQPPEVPGTAVRWAYLGIGAASGLLLGAILALFDATNRLVEHVREVWTYRDLVWNLVLRDLKARYKNSVLGYLWSLVNPLLMMGVFTVLFKFLLNNAIPNFPVFIIVALLPWNFCATSVSGAVVSITGQSALIKKIYFPREVIPIALVIANLINYLLALPAMVAIMLLLNAHFQPVALFFPVIVLIQTIFLLGLSLFLSCLNVFFRDTQVIMDVVLTAWFFLTPIFYRLDDIVPQWSRLVRWLNPMASLVDFYRDIFYLGGMPGLDAIVRTLVTALLVLFVGYLFFLRFSSRFGEEI